MRSVRCVTPELHFAATDAGPELTASEKADAKLKGSSTLSLKCLRRHAVNAAPARESSGVISGNDSASSTK